jgi:predicted metalloprotease
MWNETRILNAQAEDGVEKLLLMMVPRKKSSKLERLRRCGAGKSREAQNFPKRSGDSSSGK